MILLSQDDEFHNYDFPVQCMVTGILFQSQRNC